MRLTDFLQAIGRPVAYYPSLAEITGGAKETILLCQLVYWSGKQKDQEGWIYKSREEIKRETGLSRKEQESARENLKKRGLLLEKQAGLPRRLYFKVNNEKLENLWITHLPAIRSQSDQQADHFQANQEVPANQQEIKSPTEKIKLAEFVSMTREEHEKLKEKFGEQATRQMIEMLDNYKGAHGKRYKSDYRAILTWVADEYKKRYGGEQARPAQEATQAEAVKKRREETIKAAVDYITLTLGENPPRKKAQAIARDYGDENLVQEIMKRLYGGKPP